MEGTLRETVEMTGHRVDRGAGCIRGVALLTSTSRNKRRYTERALASAVQRFDGARVYEDHSNPPRRVRDLVGWVSSPRLDGSTVRGDLNINAHKADLAFGLAEGQSGAGLSWCGNGRWKSCDDGWQEVDEVTSVASVDLVDRPACTTGFFEREGDDGDPGPITAADVRAEFGLTDPADQPITQGMREAAAEFHIDLAESADDDGDAVTAESVAQELGIA